jgi:hypothetical protein
MHNLCHGGPEAPTRARPSRLFRLAVRDGDTAIVGGPTDDNAVGAAWIYVRKSGAWYVLGSKLVGAGAVGPAGQGVAVALSAGGDTAILGGRLDQGGVGAAWVFVATASAPAPGNK